MGQERQYTFQQILLNVLQRKVLKHKQAKFLQLLLLQGMQTKHDRLPTTIEIREVRASKTQVYGKTNCIRNFGSDYILLLCHDAALRVTYMSSDDNDMIFGAKSIRGFSAMPWFTESQT